MLRNKNLKNENLEKVVVLILNNDCSKEKIYFLIVFGAFWPLGASKPSPPCVRLCVRVSLCIQPILTKDSCLQWLYLCLQFCSDD